MTSAASPGLTARASASVQNLNPGYFALVMATAIVSIGMLAVGMTVVSAILLGLASVFYVILILLYIWRLVSFRSNVFDDFSAPAKAFAFFTFVAGSGVLGSRILLGGQVPLAIGLLAVAGIAWLFLGYGVPWSLILGRSKRPVLAQANGTWFIWTVGSQSVAVLAATLEPLVTTVQRELAIVAVFSWSVGVVLYGCAGAFVGIRLLSYDVKPADIIPPYWVSMGATAITVLAGARIVEMADAPMVNATRGLVAGLSVVFWCFGTWLVPALLAAGWWRHITHRIPLRYEAPLWSMVFPLGMYGVASINLGIADELPVVGSIGRYEIWLALVVWAIVFVGMLRNLTRTVLFPPVRTAQHPRG